MATQLTLSNPARSRRRVVANAAQAGLPDPRPVTDYTVSTSTPAGNLRVTVTLSAPCVIRTPSWQFISCNDGGTVTAPTMTIVDNRTFFFQFTGDPGSSVAFIQAPMQDMNVQNSLGGFVRSNATWFRKPT